MKARKLYHLLIVLLLCLWECGGAWATESIVPRTIIAFYHRDESATTHLTRIHQVLEMPINHLGFNLRYHEVHEPLPELTDDVHGILLSFSPGYDVDHPDALLDWVIHAAQKRPQGCGFRACRNFQQLSHD